MGQSALKASNDFKQAQVTYKAFEDAVNSGNIEKAANLQALLQKQVRGASSDLSIARYNAKEYDKSLDAIGRVKLGNYLQKWLDTNTAATKEARMEVKGYINDLQNGLITTQSQEKTIRTRIGTIEYAENRIHDREQSLYIQKQITDAIETISHKIDTIQENFIIDKIENMRWKILGFANDLINGKTCYKEQYDNILKTYDDYERILEKNNMSNGQVEESMKFIREKYHELIDNMADK